MSNLKLAEAVTRGILPEEIQYLLGEASTIETMQTAIIAHRLVYQHGIVPEGAAVIEMAPGFYGLEEMIRGLVSLARWHRPRDLQQYQSASFDVAVAYRDIDEGIPRVVKSGGHLYCFTGSFCKSGWAVVSTWRWPRIIDDRLEIVARRL